MLLTIIMALRFVAYVCTLSSSERIYRSAWAPSTVRSSALAPCQCRQDVNEMRVCGLCENKSICRSQSLSHCRPRLFSNARSLRTMMCLPRPYPSYAISRF